jgi:hypothetical protein
MIDVTNQENFSPKILLQGMLGLDGGEVIAGRDDAAIEDKEVVLGRIEDHVLATGADAITSERDQNVDCYVAGDASFHGMGRNCCL